MVIRDVSLSELLFMTDEELKVRHMAVEEFKKDMHINDYQETTSCNINTKDYLQQLKINCHKDEIKKDCTHVDSFE